MKTTVQRFLFRAALLATALTAATAARAAEKVGVYDSRVVAYAHFLRPSHQAQLKQLMADGRAAKAAGDTARYREIEQRIVADQARLHLQVFSTAPIPALLEELKERLPAIGREAGVTRLVSKWDEAALSGVGAADRVDVTAQLVRDCELDAKQQQMVEELATKEPMPLEEAKAKAAKGKL